MPETTRPTPERIAEIRDLRVDSCSGDAQHNPDVWALEQARVDLLAEVEGLRQLSEKLARRLADHAECDEHPLSAPATDCPFCGDRAAYLAYVSGGGRDFRPDNSGATVDFFEYMHQSRPLSHPTDAERGRTDA